MKENEKRKRSKGGASRRHLLPVPSFASWRSLGLRGESLAEAKGVATSSRARPIDLSSWRKRLQDLQQLE
jgi:hypothetical protein